MMYWHAIYLKVTNDPEKTDARILDEKLYITVNFYIHQTVYLPVFINHMLWYMWNIRKYNYIIILLCAVSEIYIMVMHFSD